jgi:hypothetical protein
MRLRPAAGIIGGLAIVAGSFWVTLTLLRHMESAGAPVPVQTAPSAARTTTAAAPNRGGTVTKVALGSFIVEPGSSFEGGAAEKLLTTSPQQWSYAATAPLPYPLFSAGPGRIRARLQVLQGQISILVVEKIGEAVVIAEKFVDVTDQPAQVEVDVPDVTKAREVVLRNASPNGQRARARILSIEAML